MNNVWDREAQLNELLKNYREACPDFDGGANFMPKVWAKIEAREASTNWFGRMAKVLVTAALATSAILAMVVSSRNEAPAFYNGTFVQALVVDNVATLEPLHLDRISVIEMQGQ